MSEPKPSSSGRNGSRIGRNLKRPREKLTLLGPEALSSDSISTSRWDTKLRQRHIFKEQEADSSLYGLRRGYPQPTSARHAPRKGCGQTLAVDNPLLRGD